MDADQIRRLRPQLTCYLKRFDDCFARKDTRAHLLRWPRNGGLQGWYVTPHSQPGRGRLRRPREKHIPEPDVNGLGCRTARSSGTHCHGRLPSRHTIGGLSTRV